MRKGSTVMPRSAPPFRTARPLLALCLLLALFGQLIAQLGQPFVPARARAGRSYLFLSPNTDDNLSLNEAVGRLGEPAQAHYRTLTADILRGLGVPYARVHDAVGDWSGGVENSLLAVVDCPTDAATLRCAAALFGLHAEQKAVLAFHADAAGTDVLAVLDLPRRSLAEVRQLLDEHGLRDRTIVPHDSGCRVVLLDEGGRQAVALARIGRTPGARLAAHCGRALAVAAQSRDLARRRFHEVIRAHAPTARLARAAGTPAVGVAGSCVSVTPPSAPRCPGRARWR
jgi:hypothetical protein